MRRLLTFLLLPSFALFLVLTPLSCSSNNNPSSPTHSLVRWTEATASAKFALRAGHTSVVFNNEMWVIGGFIHTHSTHDIWRPANDVWHSSDGITWNAATTQAAFPARCQHTSLVYNPVTGLEQDGKMWVIGGAVEGVGYSSDAWYSSDGTNWNEATAHGAFPIRGEFSSVVYNHAMWVVGGLQGLGLDLNDVWASTDGITWNAATTQATFSARSEFGLLSYNNAMWVIGGAKTNDSITSVSLNDVWSSTDGITWNAATTQAAFPSRAGHASVVFNGAMWVIGGINANYGYLNDTWYSYDGINWCEAKTTNTFSPRYLFTSLVYTPTKGPGKINEIWVIGGNDGTQNDCNDVWYNPF